MKLSTIVRLVVQSVFKLLPLQNKVVFENFRGRGMGDDPKYIALALLKDKSQKIKLIWLCNNVKEKYPDGIVPVKYKSLRSIYELSTAKVWVYNTKDGFKIPKRKGQFYIQTWHSSMGLKKVEKDAGLAPSYQRFLAKDAAMTDLMYANSDFRVELYKKSFWYDGEVLRSDLPRMSLLINPEKSRAAYNRVHEFYGLDEDCKIILYAPTFRNNADISLYKFDYDAVVRIAEAKFGGKFVMLLRLHPKLNRFKNEFLYNAEVIQASDYPDMQELLAASEILISDYSSSIFDFGAVGKLVLLYVPDLDAYLSSDRGLYFEMEELPFEKGKSDEALCEALYKVDMVNYKKNCQMFYNKIGYKDDGNGDVCIAQKIVQHIEKI